MREPPLWAISDHWSAASSALSGCSAEKTRENWARKPRSVVQPREDGPQAAAQEPLADRRLRQVQQHAAVEEQRAGQVDPELAAQVAGHQLGRDRGPHVVADDEDRRRACPPDQLLGGVGVPGQRVDVVGRVGEAVAERNSARAFVRDRGKGGHGPKRGHSSRRRRRLLPFRVLDREHRACDAERERRAHCKHQLPARITRSPADPRAQPSSVRAASWMAARIRT